MNRFFTRGLAVAVMMAVLVGAAIAGEARPESAKVGADVAAVADRYIAALQNGSADELRKVYMPDASYYFFREGKLVGGKIDILYDQVDGKPIDRPIVYEVTGLSVSGRIATLTIDISDLMGVHILDMFTLVQDDEGVWRMTSKVARRP